MRIVSCAWAAAANPSAARRKMAKPSRMLCVFRLDLGGVVVDVAVRAGIAERGPLALVEERDGAGSGALADESGRVRLRDDRFFVRAVPRPVDFVRRHALEVALLAVIALLLD